MSNAAPQVSSHGIVDFYRSDDSLLIHERPGGWKRGLPILLLGLFGSVFITFIFLMADFQMVSETILWRKSVAFFMYCFFCFMNVLYLYCIWVAFFLMYGHTTILLDREEIRIDWWFFGGKGSRVYSRVPKIRVKPYPASFLLGGDWGMKIFAGKNQYGNKHITQLYQYLRDRNQVSNEIVRFFKEIPINAANTDEYKTKKGRLSDADFGANLLKTLFRNGKPLQLFVPEETPQETAKEISEQEFLPGVMYLRCRKCERIIPREQVDLELPLAYCPHCDTVFEPGEFKHHIPGKQRRIEIRYHNIETPEESMEIVQKPMRFGLPVCMIIIVLLFDLFLLGFFLSIRQSFPDDNPINALRFPENPGVLIARRFLFSTTLCNVMFLFLPLWTFFDYRTIRIDAKKMHLSGRWLFFSWKRTVERIDVRKAELGPMSMMIENIAISYGKKKFVLLGCDMRQGMFFLCNEINRFLFRITPQQNETEFEQKLEPVILGNSIFCETLPVELHCKKCGHIIETKSLDITERKFECPTCEAVFPLKEIFTCENFAPDDTAFPPEHISITETPEELTIRCVPACSLAEKIFTYISAAFIITYFWGLLLFFTGLILWSGEFHFHGQVIFLTVFGIPFLLGACFITLRFLNDIGALYSSWDLRLDSRNLELTLRYHTWKKWFRFTQTSKTIVIPRNEIVEAEPNLFEPSSSPWKNLGIIGVPDYISSRERLSSHLRLNDGTKYYLPSLGSWNAESDSKEILRGYRNGIIATINRFLASHPAEV